MTRNANDTDLHAVRTALDGYVAAWNSQRVSGLKAFWDADKPDPLYVAEEAEVMRGWPAIDAYWAALDGLDVHIAIGDVQLSRLTDDVLVALYPMHWRIRFAQHAHWDRPIGGQVRVSVTFARRGPHWKIVHYIEAPFAPAIQLKKWLERDAQA